MTRAGLGSAVLAGLLLAAAAAAAAREPDWAPDALLVKFAPGVDAAGKAALVPGERLRAYPASGIEHWRLAPGGDPLAVAARLAADPRVAYAEPDYLLRVALMPGDPLLPQQWGLHNTGQVVGSTAGTPDADVDAPEAWDLHTDASSVIVAVLDTGIDLAHPDLAANLWVNPGEVAGNGLDDDDNGFIDDVNGWDFYNGDAIPADDSSHGTHCAGIIAAVADNGIGGAGLAWGARLMPLKFQSASGVGTTSSAIAGIEYAIAKGADVINASWGNRSFSQALLDAIVAADEAGIFFVAAAGNEGTDNDALAYYPCGYDVPNVISVMATDNRDRRSDEYNWASNYGATKVDIAAPGTRIWSTVRNGGYMYLSGTSMAAPHVAGALALLRARFPGITVDEGRFRLLAVGHDEVPSLAGQCATGGRLNVRKLVADPDEAPPPAIADLAVATVASNWVALEWTSPGDDRGLDGWEARFATTPIIDEASWAAATAAPGSPPAAPEGDRVSMRVTGLAAGTAYWFAARARDEYANLGAISGSPTATTLPPPAIAVSPASLAVALDPGGSATRTVSIANPGPGVLDFTIPHHVEAAAKAGSGGPDGYGYDWIDSDTPGGPAFTWTDIAAAGNAVTLNYDSNQGPFEIGFQFPYYGIEHTTFAISTHGCISLSSGWTTGANVALPTPAASGNLLALLWDEMITGSGTCHYLNDGARLVIQYTGLDNAGPGGPFTMQMRLYPDGVIEYAYLSAPAPSPTGATVGLQDADGSDGLTISHNAAYVHGGLLVRIAPPPPWLGVAPASGSVPAGASLDVAVTIDTAGLCGTRFDGSLHVLSNAPFQADTKVPVRLDLASPPDIAVAPDSLAFGAVRLTESATLEVAVTNPGCGPLTVSAVTVTGAGFACAPDLPYVLGPGSAGSLAVTFAPMMPGAVAGTLALHTDDPDEPVTTVALGGVGEFIPDIAVTPDSLAATLPTGGVASRQLTITNHGIAPLTWSIPAATYVRATGAASDMLPDEPGGPAGAATKGAAPPDTSALLPLGAGGPDAFGYRWVDSDATRGPAYNWIEIQSGGTMLPFEGNGSVAGPLAIGFSFPFYGRNYTTVRVGGNGWISFGSSLPGAINQPLPYGSTYIMPYWDALDYYQTSGRAFYKYDGQRLIVEYKNVPRALVGGICSFQVHLYPSGRIEFHYQGVPTFDQSATIGIQGHLSTYSTQVAYNSAYAHGGLAVRLESATEWLSATPASGVLTAGAEATVAVNFDAALMCSGANQATLHVLSNDPDSPDIAVPVTLTAEVGPDPRLTPTSLEFGTTYIGQSGSRSLVLANIGCAPLSVTGLSCDNAAFTVGTVAPFSIAAGASRTIDVSFTPLATGADAGTLSIATGSVTWPSLAVPLAGTGQYAGSAVLSPASVAVVVQPESQRTATVRVENQGTGDLVWGAAVASTSKSTPAGTPLAAAMQEGSGADVGDGPPAAPLGSGGPDAGGYRWIDSDSPGGPVFSWIEIAGTGTPALAAGTDVMAGPFGAGFTVPHYDYNSSTFWVHSDGWICLVSSGHTSMANTSLPSSRIGYSGIAPFWDDLDLSVPGSGDIWYKRVDGNLVVEWDHVMRRGTTTPVTFELIVSPSGAITFQYLSVSGAATNSATVGIQNNLATIGLQVVFNQAYLHDNLAIHLWRPRWAAVTPPAGIIAPGSSADLVVTFNAAGVLPGDHQGVLTFQSNDLASPSLTVPLVMTVKDYVSAVEPPRPAAVSLSQNAPNPFNPRTMVRFALPQDGPVELRVYDLRGRHVRTLAEGRLPAGFHERSWDGLTEAGHDAPSGVYFCRLRAGETELTRRMTLLR